jgi:fructokinase
VLARRRVPTPRDSYEGTIAGIVGLVEELERATERTGTVGLGIPGAVSRATQLVKNANSTWLNGRPLQDDLGRALGRPVRLANDANCFALSESTDGAASGARVAFGVILGTGTGGGLVVDGQVIVGANAIAGEWGHNPLPWPSEEERRGPSCYCGRRGCIETYLSGPGLTARFCEATGEASTAPEIVRRAAEGDAAAESVMASYEDRLARGLASVMNIVDPDVIVVGGGLSHIDRLYEHVPALWLRYVFSDTVTTRLVRARHGDASGVRGAAWLWNHQDLGIW